MNITKWCIKKSFGLYQRFYEFYLRQQPCTGQVLMFHEVYCNGTQPNEGNIAISEDNFTKLILSLKERYNFVSLQDNATISRMTAKDILLTFDDPFASAYHNAFPILEIYNIPYTVFISKCYINCPNFITSEELLNLANRKLCTIGAHTLSHSKLRFITQSEAQHEIADVRTWLHQLLGYAPQSFAYPYGSMYCCSKENINTVKSSGYTVAFSTLNAPLSRHAVKNMFFVPRINVNDDNYLKRVNANGGQTIN